MDVSEEISVSGLIPTTRVIEPKTFRKEPVNQSSLPPLIPKVIANGSNNSELKGNTILSSKMADVRVDNWGNYCLQRLQNMYEKGENCDLTLQFSDLNTIKVHRLVLNLCTDYFANLEHVFGTNEDVLLLPNDISFECMTVIIKFFYTGKLEVRGADFSDIYRTVKLMNVNILMKLLEAHSKKPDQNVAQKTTGTPLMLKAPGPHGIKSIVTSGMTASSVSTGIRKKIAVGGTGHLPPGIKRKTVLARVQQQPVKVQGRGHAKSSTVVPKKLPVWRDKKPIISVQKAEPQNRRILQPQKIEPPRPTRFEWPDPEDDKFGEDFRDASSNDMIASSLPQNSSLVFDIVKNQVDIGGKTPKEDDSIHSKIEQELAEMEGGEETSESSYSVPPLTKAECKINCDVISQETSDNMEVESAIEVTTTETISPDSFEIEQTVVCDENIPVPKLVPNRKMVKTVRFADDSVSDATQDGKILTCQDDSPLEDDPPNHSRIIAEVLKKYPELVKENKCVKLKIVQKGPPEPGAKEGKTKVSYIVLNSSSSDAVGSVLPKKSSSTKSSFWDPDGTKKVSNAAENMNGPWLCEACGTADSPLSFDSYFLHRKHLVEVHGEKVDVRICEHCGYKASKRNLLLHHLYTKHSIPPPSNYNFPQCDQCSYIALTESLLVKHKSTHSNLKDLICKVCFAKFKSNSALQTHLASNVHRNSNGGGAVHTCPYCEKTFPRIQLLKGHVRVVHKDILLQEDHEDSGLDGSLTVEGKSFTIADAEQQYVEVEGILSADGQTAEVISNIHGGITVPISIIPSSEAEALSSVANSIAASLGLGSHQIHTTPTGETFSDQILGDGAAQQVFVLDNSSEVAGDGTVLLSEIQSVDGDGQIIVQDIHGNKFRKISGTDAEGNPVLFFQLAEDNTGQVQLGVEENLEESQQISTTDEVTNSEYDLEDKSSLSIQNDHMYLDPQKCSVFVSSDGGLSVPVTLNQMQQSQTLVTYSGDGSHVIELLPLTSVESLDIHTEQNDSKPEETEDSSQMEIETLNETDVLSSNSAEEAVDEIHYEHDQTNEVILVEEHLNSDEIQYEEGS